MEKLKHLIHPGKATDDEILYGSGQSSDPLHSGTGNKTAGEGSHLAAATSGDQQAGHGTSGLGSTSTDTTGPHSSNLANMADPRVDSDRDGSRTSGAHHAAEISASGYDSTATENISGGRGHTDPLAGNVNKPLPHTPASFTGAPGTGSTLGNLPDRTVGGSGSADHAPTSTLGRDATLGGAAAAGTGVAAHHHHNQPDRYRNDPSYRSTDLDPTSGQASGATGYTGTSGLGRDAAVGGVAAHHGHHGHHDQTDPYRNDPSYRSTGPDSTSGQASGVTGYTGTSGLGRDAAVGGIAATGVGATAHHGHHDQTDPYRNEPSYGTTDVGSTSQQSSGLVGHPGSSSLGRDAAVGGVAAAGVGAAAHHHHHDQVDPYRSGPSAGSTTVESGTFQRLFPLSGGLDTVTAASGSDHPTSGTTSSTATGPHSSNLLNKLDPRVGSDVEGSRTVGSIGSGQTGLTSPAGGPVSGSSHHHAGRDAALGVGAMGAGGAALGHHDEQPGISRRHIDPDPGTSGTFPSEASILPDASPGTDLREHYHMTHGPHSTGTANLLDPQLTEGELSGSGRQAGSSSFPGHEHSHTRSGAEYENTRGDRHTGRDAALATGGAAAATAASGGHQSQGTSTGPASSTAGPHNSNLLNKLDPRVDSDQDGSRTFGSVPGTVGNYDKVDTGGAPTGSSTGLTRDGQQVVGRETNYDRDTSRTGTAAAGGVGGYEAGQRHHEPGYTTGATGTGHGGSTTGAHHGRDAAALGGAAAVGTGAYEVGKHHHETGGMTGTGGYGPGSTSTTSTYGPADTSGPLATSGTGTYGSQTGYTTDPSHKDHHFGRDAAVLGGSAAAGTGLYEAEKHHQAGGATTGTRAYGDPSGTSGLTGASGVGTQGATSGHTLDPSHKDHHYGRDAAAAGAVTAGGVEYERHEAEKARHTDHTVIEKEKHHHVGSDKHHKEEKEGHHGLLGFLHRDKNKHQTTEEEPSHHRGTTGATAGAAGVGTAAAVEHERHEHHERNRLHKDPPKGYAAQVTGGTGTTELAQGDSVQRGSHISGLGNKLDPNVAERGDTV